MIASQMDLQPGTRVWNLHKLRKVGRNQFAYLLTSAFNPKECKLDLVSRQRIKDKYTNPVNKPTN
jgi:hypothetical protein